MKKEKDAKQEYSKPTVTKHDSLKNIVLFTIFTPSMPKNSGKDELIP